ncbi:cardioacceleratory peptide receptor-like [Mizuhopecten yessoensis]|uniref:Cardioacceleratory peptide receptor n=1 Tax=Mizuhopecten yessoensis TaxID=6573 RepID=A0A210Q263_MIZYE|nr:cardioacceleratory peptide receptor-like [Mizuhopecten yessoensis]OWF42848.1 Cardioacceleratory peptide receptor [Mizuhopecten yessoensis]
MKNWSAISEVVTMTFTDNATELVPNRPETYSDHKLIWNIATAIICVEFVCAFILNAIVIGLLKRNKKRNRMSFFVLHLAISDFLMAVFYIFPVVIDRLLDVWLAGLFMCKLIKYLSLVVCFASTYMLVVLSVDRLYAIARPLSATKRGMFYKWTLVIIAWVIAAMLGIYDLVFAKIVTGIPTPAHDIPFCEIIYPDNMTKPLILLFASTNMFVPAVLIGACYTTIVLILWRRGRQGIPLSNPDVDSYTTNSRLKSDSGIIHRAKIKTIKITFVVVSVFIACWGPFTFYSILLLYHLVPMNGSFFIVMSLAPLNSVANPVVFLLFNYRTLCERKRKNRYDHNGTTTTTKTTFTTYLQKDSDWSKNYPMSRVH